MNQQKKIFKLKVGPNDQKILLDFLNSKTSLSKQMIKLAMNAGAVWRKKNNEKKMLRIRKVKTELAAGDWLEVYYDAHLLKKTLEEVGPPLLIEEHKHWSLWHKPAGMLAQGTKYGDHLSLLRFVEKAKGRAFLIHRLDREAQGLMVVAHSPQGASLLSQLWQQKKVTKIYQVQVLGLFPEGVGFQRMIDLPLPFEKEEQGEKKLREHKAETHIRVVAQNEDKEEGKHTSSLLVQIQTGRLHQIRRHLDMIGHPVLGDPIYGKGNKNKEGLKLMATRLEFIDPESRRKIVAELPAQLRLFAENSTLL